MNSQTPDKPSSGDAREQWKHERFLEGKSCDNCLHRDRCLYDHNPGKNYICWKRDPRVR